MTRTSRREVLEKLLHRYAKAGRRAKGTMLDEFCHLTGYHRKYAVRLLSHPPRNGPRIPPRRPRIYGPAVVRALEGIWKAAGYPWSVRLKALLPLWVPWARRRYGLTPAVEKLLLAISPRQIDRRLKDRKRELTKRLYGRTKPGSLLKHHIPLRTDRWQVIQPGFTEIDLVAHCGSNGDGQFIHSLNLTDIHSTWVETCALMGRSQGHTREALERIRLRLPFKLLGIDSDNGSEFINEHLLDYCRQHQVQFTRGRPYKKDDNAHIEQKNWTHVRKLMGYVRYETDTALEAMNRLYSGELRVLQNLFMPSVKLISKERVGSRVRRRYDRPRTPLERLAGCQGVDHKALRELRALRARLDPFALSAEIDRQLARIHSLAQQWNKTSLPQRRPNSPWGGSYKNLSSRPRTG